MTELEHAIKHIKTRADAWAVKEVTEALQSISERLEPCTDAVSREAVMKIVDEEWICNADYDFRSLVESIEKLPSVNPQPCDDAVSREYLLDNCVVDKVTMPYVPVSKIKNAPPVTQKSGKWIKSIDYIGNVKCSICQKEYDQDVLYDAKYCPNCGAKMKREDEK